MSTTSALGSIPALSRRWLTLHMLTFFCRQLSGSMIGGSVSRWPRLLDEDVGTVAKALARNVCRHSTGPGRSEFRRASQERFAGHWLCKAGLRKVRRLTAGCRTPRSCRLSDTLPTLSNPDVSAPSLIATCVLCGAKRPPKSHAEMGQFLHGRAM